MAGVVKSVALDALMSFLFIFLGSTAGATVMLIAPYFGEDESTSLMVLLSVIGIQIVVFCFIGEALGGASFNPTVNLSNYWLCDGKESVLSMGLKVPAQLAGAVLGAFAILEVMPPEYKHTLSGPKLGPGVDIWTGALAEGALTFVITLVATWIFMAGPASPAAKIACLVVSVLTLIVVGAPYSGPAMNPVLAFTWAYVSKEHATKEHFYVYWVAPIVGTILASIVVSLTFHPKRRAKAAAAKSVEGEKNEEGGTKEEGKEVEEEEVEDSEGEEEEEEEDYSGKIKTS